MRIAVVFLVEEKWGRESTRAKKRNGKKGETRYKKVEGNGSTRARCHEPETCLSIARSVDCSSNSDSTGDISARETYSRDTISIAVIDLASSTTWQEDVTAVWDEYAKTGGSEYVIAHRKGMGIKAENCITVGSVQPFLGQAVHEMVATEMGDIEAPRFRQGTTKTFLKGLYYRELFRGDKEV